ncbi:MAG: ATP-binding protein [Betaproteobacteria bacterium]|nr:ATP-binding protein [Betaproteobacteria bacterium]
MITHGFSGCGKTTLSQGMLEAIGAVRIRSDIERKRLAGLPATARSGSAIAGGMYREDMNERTYGQLLSGAESIIAAGAIAIVDATFLQRGQRELFRRLARQRGVPFTIVSFQASEAELRARIAARQSRGDGASEADLAVLEHQLATAEALAPDELPDEVRFETTGLLAIAWERKTWRPLMDRLGTQ